MTGGRLLKHPRGAGDFIRALTCPESFWGSFSFRVPRFGPQWAPPPVPPVPLRTNAPVAHGTAVTLRKLNVNRRRLSAPSPLPPPPPPRSRVHCRAALAHPATPAPRPHFNARFRQTICHQTAVPCVESSEPAVPPSPSVRGERLRLRLERCRAAARDSAAR